MAKSIFKQHPNLTDAFQTTDGQFFYTENAANLHAKTLDNKLVKRLVNDSIESSPVGKGSLNVEEMEAASQKAADKKAKDDEAKKAASQKAADKKAKDDEAKKAASQKAADKKAKEAAANSNTKKPE